MTVNGWRSNLQWQVQHLNHYLFQLSFSSLCVHRVHSITMLGALEVVHAAYCALYIVKLTLHYITLHCHTTQTEMTNYVNHRNTLTLAKIHVHVESASV